MRIGIDARKLHDFGIGTYIRNLLRHLARIDSQTEFVILCRPEDRATLAALGENFRTVSETSGNYSVAEQVKIPLELKREGVTLFHAPHYVLPPLVPCRSVVTIHDCIHLMFPQYLPNRFALQVERLPRSAGGRKLEPATLYIAPTLLARVAFTSTAAAVEAAEQFAAAIEALVGIDR